MEEGFRHQLFGALNPRRSETVERSLDDSCTAGPLDRTMNAAHQISAKTASCGKCALAKILLQDRKAVLSEDVLRGIGLAGDFAAGDGAVGPLEIGGDRLHRAHLVGREDLRERRPIALEEG